MTIKDFSELIAKALIYNGPDGDPAPSRPPGLRLAIAPTRYLDTTDQHTHGNHGRHANGRSKQSRSVHSRDCWEHHLHCDETAIRRLKHARAG
eukprot:jgi/Tetstr1/426742/TSEL_001679.t1